METIQIDIINPRAEKLIKELEALKLISIRKTSGEGFLQVVKKIRSNAKKDALSLAAITKEVELVRSKRYAGKKA